MHHRCQLRLKPGPGTPNDPPLLEAAEALGAFPGCPFPIRIEVKKAGDTKKTSTSQLATLEHADV